MSAPIRILVLHDVPAAVSTIQREITEGLPGSSVQSADMFDRAHNHTPPDVIVCGATADISHVLGEAGRTPVLVLAEAIDADRAEQWLRAGAADYLAIDQMPLLAHSIRHACRTAQLRQHLYDAEVARHSDEQHFRALLDILPDPMITTDAGGHLTFVSPSAIRLFGGNADDMLGHSMFEWLHPSQHQRALLDLQQVLSDQPVLNQEYMLQRDGSDMLFCEASAALVKGGQGEQPSVMILLRDISWRKHQQQQVLYQASLLENMPDAVIATDRAFVITSWNRAAETIYGWQTDDVLGKRIDQLLGNTYVHAHPGEALEAFQKHGFWTGEVIQRHKNGSDVYIQASVTMLRDINGKPIGAVAVNRDITQHKRAEAERIALEEQLHQAQKMESIGRLTGGVAHDFNNLLTVISGYSELIRHKLIDGDPLIDDVNQIRQATDRAADFVRQLLAFSRKQILEPMLINLNEMISDLQPLLEDMLGPSLDLVIRLDREVWNITADPSQIEQVIMNVVLNARDAMPNGGSLRIATRNAVLADDSELLPGPYVVLEISDTGVGMDEQTLSQIFEPFFTTKDISQGTGLGLSTVYGIVKQSNGSISVTSSPGEGTTFVVALPATGAVVLEPITATQPSQRHGKETVLLVEDQGMVRKLVRLTLESEGYTVLEAYNGVEALDVSDGYGDAIDLLLTDAVMPLMGGQELAEQIKQKRPAIKVLFMSGYTEDAAIRHGLLEAKVEFLAKPFSPSMLVARLRQVLES